MRFRSLLRVRAGAVLAATAVAATAGPAVAGHRDHGRHSDAATRQADRQPRKAERQTRRAERQTRRVERVARGKRPAREARPVTGGRGKSDSSQAPAKAKTGAGSGKAPTATQAQPVAAVALPPAPVPAAVPAPATGEANSERPRPPKTKRRAKSKNRTATSVPGRVPGDPATSRGGLGARAPSGSPGARAPSGSPPRGSPRPDRVKSEQGGKGSPAAPVTRTVRQLIEVVPEPVKMLLAALGVLSIVLGGGYMLTAARARRLSRQRSDLLQEVGLLQTALLPPVPATVGAVKTSVAYRPSDGPGAGGDFYDAMTLPGGRAAFILGDVSGHGRAALARTAFMRYTLRAYLEAGLDPRTTLQVAGRVIDEHLGGDFATVVLAVHDPGSGSLTYACAGHPAPIVVGPGRHEPVLAASSPPIGLGMRTGLRQTTLPLPSGSVVCLYTDGLAEARTERGILGRPRLGDIVEGLGRGVTAQQLLDRVAEETRLVTDDMATVVLTPTAGVTAGGFRCEQLEVDAAEADGDLPRQFLEACGVSDGESAAAESEIVRLARVYGGAVLHVDYGIRGPRADVLPRNVESLEAASRRAAVAIG